jgi:hypothetical protein
MCLKSHQLGLNLPEYITIMSLEVVRVKIRKIILASHSCFAQTCSYSVFRAGLSWGQPAPG